MGVGWFLERHSNLIHNTFNILQHFIVPKAQHSKATSFKISCVLISMLSAIHLNDQSCFNAREIGNIAIDRMLTAEAMPIFLLLAQMLPQKFLSVRLGMPQLPGLLCNSYHTA